MPIDYNFGKIYKIENKLDPTEFYIGSTAQKTLAMRMAGHRKACNSERKMYAHLYARMNEVGIDNFQILLIEAYPCKSKDELFTREDHFIKELKPSLNCCRAKLTDVEIRERDRKNKEEWYLKNRDNIIQNSKKMERCDHCDRVICHYNMSRHKRTSYCMNFAKSISNTPSLIKVKCDSCDRTVTQRSINKHKKTKRCKDFKLNYKQE